MDEQTVLILRSKTDQEGAVVVQFIGEPKVTRIRTRLEIAFDSEGALFRPVHKSGCLRKGCLPEARIRRIIIRHARDAGAQGRISGHSLRVGSAQSLATAGSSPVEMQPAGRSQSLTMPGRYAQGQLAKQGAVAKLRMASEAGRG